MIFPASQIITHNYRHWVYYNGFLERHGIPDRGPHGIDLATLKRDRFISFTAIGAEPGTILTKTFRLEGSRLQVNGQCESIRLELLDKTGRITHTTESDKLDALRWEPRWEDDRELGSAKGEIIQLRFHLKNALL